MKYFHLILTYYFLKCSFPFPRTHSSEQEQTFKLQMTLREKWPEGIGGIWEGGCILKQSDLFVPYSLPLNSHYRSNCLKSVLLTLLMASRYQAPPA